MSETNKPKPILVPLSKKELHKELGIMPPTRRKGVGRFGLVPVTRDELHDLLGITAEDVRAARVKTIAETALNAAEVLETAGDSYRVDQKGVVLTPSEVADLQLTDEPVIPSQVSPKQS